MDILLHELVTHRVRTTLHALLGHFKHIVESSPSATASSNTGLTHQGLPHLLPLPAELRHKIYALLRGTHDEFCPLAERNRYNMPKGPSNDCPAFLRTCKQINSEAAQYLYSCNLFRFPGSGLASKWLDAMGNNYASIIVEMDIRSRSDEIETLKAVFETGTGLRRLHVHGPMTDRELEFRKKRTGRFLFLVKPWLKAHPTLKLPMIKYSGALQPGNDPEASEGWNAISVTFVASTKNAAEDDGKVFDLEAEIQAWKTMVGYQSKEKPQRDDLLDPRLSSSGPEKSDHSSPANNSFSLWDFGED